MAVARAQYPAIQTLFVDSDYAGQGAQTISQRHWIRAKIARHPANTNTDRWFRPEQPDPFAIQAEANGFMVLARRWVVERTLTWNQRARQTAIHNDRRPSVSDELDWLTETRMLLGRLTASSRADTLFTESRVHRKDRLDWPLGTIPAKRLNSTTARRPLTR